MTQATKRLQIKKVEISLRFIALMHGAQKARRDDEMIEEASKLI
jgi:hypothetical protein